MSFVTRIDALRAVAAVKAAFASAGRGGEEMCPGSCKPILPQEATEFGSR